eukprot:GEMP01074587.1.p1 GENE.GEMP01074587.1~~GEMP01074587.1.p1  ORF type:complete len:286 (+),score=71.36 GEMP01074587.1:86-943(+)
MNTRRVYVRRTVIFIAVVFWLAVMATGIYALYTISRDDLVVALHHLSVGVFLLTFGGLGTYVEIKRARVIRTARQYCLEHLASSFVYLLMAGFIVDPLPVASKSAAPKGLAPFFYTVAGLGVSISIVKCSLGCLKPHRHSVASRASSVVDGEELRSLRERLSNPSPALNERPVPQHESMLYTRSSTTHMNYDAPVATNPFVPKGVHSAQPVAAATPPRKQPARAVPSSSPSDDNALNPFATDAATDAASVHNPFDADKSSEAVLETPEKADRARSMADRLIAWQQ